MAEVQEETSKARLGVSLCAAAQGFCMFVESLTEATA
jgi:hypothetical protein